MSVMKNRKTSNPDLHNKAIKVCLYPNNEQIVLLSKTFGCCRKIWNLMLADKNEYYKMHKEILNVTPALYKSEYPYLKEVDSLALANVQLNLNVAFKNFFNNRKHFGYPKFKEKKTDKKKYTTNLVNNNIVVGDNFIKLPKIGIVKAKIHRKPLENWVLKSVTVSCEAGKYYASILYSYEIHIEKIQKIEDKQSIGFDYANQGLYVDNEGHNAKMPKFYQKAQKKLSRSQKAFSKKQNGSHNYYKAQEKLQKECMHVSNQRRDWQHKLSTEIANQYDIVCVEDLSLKGISSKKNKRHYGKTVHNNAYGQFLWMLEYKLDDRGKYLVKVSKWYPSSQLCNVCNTKNPEIKDVRITKWVCPICNTAHDRNQNAAINIRNEGLRILKEEILI